jgi:hypothetical protein
MIRLRRRRTGLGIEERGSVIYESSVSVVGKSE